MTDDLAAHYDVLVVGAGPTGTALATLLGARGRRVGVLEMHAELYPLPRAVHVDDEVLRILHELGVGDDFAKVSIAGLGLQLIDHDHRAIVRFERHTDTPSGLPQASMFDQPDLELLLRENLGRHPSVDLLLEREVVGLRHEADGVRVQFRAQNSDSLAEVSASYVVACDGARSVVRRQLGIGTVDLGFEQRWLVVDVRSRQRLDAWDGVHQLADHERAGTYMRVGADRYRWEFQLRRDETAADFQELSRLRPLISPWLGQVADSELELVRVVEYTFRARVADSWRRGRVLLAGDAAHLTPPFIGQGLCAGLRDAANLGWKLDRALDAEFRVADLLLASYESERRPHATEMIGRAVMLGHLMTGGGRMGSRLRRAVGPLLGRLPGLGEAMLDSATPPLVAGPLVRDSAPRSVRGQLLPLVRVLGPGGSPELVDRLLGDEVAIVSLAAPCLGADDLRIPVLVIDPEADGAGDGERHLIEWFGRHGVTWAVVRPDRVVLAAGVSRRELLACRELVRVVAA